MSELRNKLKRALDRPIPDNDDRENALLVDLVDAFIQSLPRYETADQDIHAAGYNAAIDDIIAILTEAKSPSPGGDEVSV